MFIKQHIIITIKELMFNLLMLKARCTSASRVCGVDEELVASARSSVPAAVALFLLDAGVVTPLMTRVTEVWRQHVCPQTLVLRRDEAGHRVARLDPAVTAQLIAVVHALLLRQRQTLPSLVKVTQPRVQLPVVDAACDQILVFVDVELDSTHALEVVCVDVLHVLHLLEALIHLHLFDRVAQSAEQIVVQQLLPHDFSSDHDVGVTVRVLWMRRRARARV